MASPLAPTRPTSPTSPSRSRLWRGPLPNVAASFSQELFTGSGRSLRAIVVIQSFSRCSRWSGLRCTRAKTCWPIAWLDGTAEPLVFRAILNREGLDIAESYIQERREIELSQIRRQNRDLSDWMLRTVRLTKLGAPPPIPVAYVATNSSLLHLETAGGVTLCQHKHTKGARKLSSPMRTSDKYEAFAWLKESCAQCFSLAGARWQAP